MVNDIAPVCEITDIKTLTRAEQREFCLQVVYQKAGDKRFGRVITFLTDLALWLARRPLTEKQVQALQKIIDTNRLAYHRVGYLQRSKDDLSRTVERTGLHQAQPAAAPDRHQYEKVRDLFLETFSLTDITGIEIQQLLENLSVEYPYTEIQDAFFKVRKYRAGKTLAAIARILKNTRAILARGRDLPAENHGTIGEHLKEDGGDPGNRRPVAAPERRRQLRIEEM